MFQIYSTKGKKSINLFSKENPWNIYLRDDIEEKKDYEIVNKKINDFFHSSYDGKVINRNVIGEGAERYTEVNLLRF